MKVNRFLLLGFGLLTLMPWAQVSAVSQSEASASLSPTAPVRSSRLLGATVQSNNGELLGRVEDLVLDPNNQSVAFVIVGGGRSLGLEPERRLVPWQALSMKSPQLLSLNMTKAKFRSAPTLVSVSPLILSNSRSLAELYAFYAEASPAVSGAAESPGGTQTGTGVAFPRKDIPFP